MHIDRASQISILVFLAALMLVVALVVPRFFEPSNLSEILTRTSIFAIVGLGALCVIATGGIDVSAGAIFTISGVSAAAAASSGLGLVPSVLVGVGVGAALGTVNALFIAVLQVTPIIATLGTASVFSGALVLLTDGGTWIVNLPREFTVIGLGRVAGLRIPMIISAGVCVIVWYVLTHTPGGRRVFAVGSSADAARFAGINRRLVEGSVYIANGALLGLASTLTVARLGQAQTNLGDNITIVAVTIAVVGGASIFGGTGSVFGIVLGAALVQVTSVALNFLRVDALWVQVLQGTFILFAVVLTALRAGSNHPAGGNANEVPSVITKSMRGVGFPVVVLSTLLVIVIVTMSMLSPYFLSVRNLTSTLALAVPLGLLAIGMTYVILVGGIDLSVGSTLALSAVSMGSVAELGAPAPIVIGVGLLVGAACGTFNGLIIAYLRLPPIVVTIATMSLFSGLALAMTVGRSYRFPPELSSWSLASFMGVPIPLFLLAAVFIIAWVLMTRTTYGERLFALGTNPSAFRFAALRHGEAMLSTYLISGLLSGVAAVVFSAMVSSARADFATGYELSAITVVVVGGALLTGGRASLWASLVALIIITLLRNGLGLALVPTEVQTMFVGFTLLTTAIIYRWLPEWLTEPARSHDRTQASSRTTDQTLASSGGTQPDSHLQGEGITTLYPLTSRQGEEDLDGDREEVPRRAGKERRILTMTRKRLRYKQARSGGL